MGASRPVHAQRQVVHLMARVDMQEHVSGTSIDFLRYQGRGKKEELDRFIHIGVRDRTYNDRKRNPKIVHDAPIPAQLLLVPQLRERVLILRLFAPHDDVVVFIRATIVLLKFVEPRQEG